MVMNWPGSHLMLNSGGGCRRNVRVSGVSCTTFVTGISKTEIAIPAQLRIVRPVLQHRTLLEFFHLTDELGEAVLGVAEQHHALLIVIQIIIHAGETRSHAAFEH